jgi:hypothetical protein
VTRIFTAIVETGRMSSAASFAMAALVAGSSRTAKRTDFVIVCGPCGINHRRQNTARTLSTARRVDWSRFVLIVGIRPGQRVRRLTDLRQYAEPSF